MYLPMMRLEVRKGVEPRYTPALQAVAFRWLPHRKLFTEAPTTAAQPEWAGQPYFPGPDWE